MARPREFDREAALEQAMHVFWAKGYAGASTEDLVQAMGIGRQSLYNSFGDKWQLYVQALTDYQRRSTSAHVKRLQTPASALKGIRAMLQGLVASDDKVRAWGCMGVGSACEFGASEPQLTELRAKSTAYLRPKLAERVRHGQSTGEIDPTLDAEEAANYLLMCMTGILLAARGGAKPEELRRLARFTAERLQAR
jgi:TetR/AcrR family transcriptional regulator, transcriptional repressor for nem operon